MKGLGERPIRRAAIVLGLLSSLSWAPATAVAGSLPLITAQWSAKVGAGSATVRFYDGLKDLIYHDLILADTFKSVNLNIVNG